MYYLNSRFYDPEIGRFVNADTVELVLASQATLTDKNLYSYCNNNPVNGVDSKGYFAVSALMTKVAIDVSINILTSIAVDVITGEKIEIKDLMVGALVTAATSLSWIDDISVAVMSGLMTAREVSKKYTWGTSLIAGGVTAFMTYAGFNSTALKAVAGEDFATVLSVSVVSEVADTFVAGITDVVVGETGTRRPTRLVIKELIRKDENAGKATYVKDGKSCVLV